MLISNVEVFFCILDIFIFLIFNNFDKITFDNYIFKNFIFFYSWICEIILHFAEKLLKLYVTSTNREIAFIKKTLGESNVVINVELSLISLLIFVQLNIKLKNIVG